jgi:hypothetical protein
MSLIRLFGISILWSKFSLIAVKCGRSRARSDGDKAASNKLEVLGTLEATMALSLMGQEHRSVS